MSEFVKKKTGRIETDDRGSARGPNIPQRKIFTRTLAHYAKGSVAIPNPMAASARRMLVASHSTASFMIPIWHRNAKRPE